MKVTIRRFPYYPLFVGMYPILFLWAANLGQIAPGAVLRSVVVSLLFALAVQGTCLLLLRKPHQASAAAGFFLLMFTLYGNLFNLIGGKTYLGITWGFLKLLVVFIVGLGLGLVLLLRSRANFQPLTLAANIVFGALCLFSAGRIVYYEAAAAWPSAKATPVSASASQSSSALPNVYYIIIDSYMRTDALQQEFQYDNSAFIAGLRQRGFYVADCAFSNYRGTSLSIASSLNMAYLEDLGLNSADLHFRGDPPELQQAIQHSRVRQVFAAHGYRFAAFRGFYPINDIRNADYYFEAFQDEGWNNTLAQMNFEHMYAKTTLLRALIEYYQMNKEADQWKNLPIALYTVLDPDGNKFASRSYWWYRQHMYAFDKLETLPDLPENFIVYAHIYAAHQPFTMNADGSFRWPINEDNYNYIPAIQYSSQRILQVIDTIIKKSKVPPIIVLQGDHGVHTGLTHNKILNAYYLPGKTDKLYPTITPVNTFRLILKEYFHEPLELLPDTVTYVPGGRSIEEMPAACGK